MKKKFLNAINNFKFIFFVYVILVLLIACQSYFGGIQIFENAHCTHYNNYLIFKQSFFHLIGHQDLYKLYPAEYWDLYKYSPSFALLMAPLAILPNFTGLILWDLLNALTLFLAIKYLPKINGKTKVYMLWFIVLELITSIQNVQSNGFIAALIIFSFILFERNQYLPGTLLIILSVYIKLFGIVAFALLLLYPNKVKNIAYSIFWGVVLFLLPCIVISPHQLIDLYRSWGQLISSDTLSPGLYMYGWLHAWFKIDPPKIIILLLGVALFCLPLFRIKLFKEFYFRIMLLSSVLIWVVIFNQKAESPTFIIAISGVALWYFPQIRKTENLVLLILALVFTSLSPTDIFPHSLRVDFFQPYVIKVVPCILIWFKLIYDMMIYKTTETETI